MISARLFEELMDLLEENRAQQIAARFRPTAARLNEITGHAQGLLENASDKDFHTFTE